MLHFLQSQTFGWFETWILFGFRGVPSKPTSFALAVFTLLFTMAWVSHNRWQVGAVIFVTDACSLKPFAVCSLPFSVSGNCGFRTD
jgi:hypothetical protein